VDHKEQAGKNFAWGAFSQMITRVFGLGFFVFMSYFLLEKGMGQYNFISSFVPFWFVLSDFGISGYLYREWSAGLIDLDKIRYDFNLVLTLKLIMSVIIFIPFCIVNWFINQEIFFALVLYYIFLVMSIVVSQIETYLNSTNNFRLGAIRSIIEKIIVISVGGISLYIFPNVESVFLAMVISQFVALLYYFTGRFPFRPSFVFVWTYAFDLIKKGIPFALFSIFLTVYGRIDMVMLKFMKNFETVGWYSAAYKAYEMANIFPGVLFLPAIFPVMSRIVNLENREKYRNFLNSALRILFTSSLLLSIFFIFFAHYVISWFFPDSFVPSVLAMRIIVLVLTSSSLGWLFSNLLIIQKKEKISLGIIVVSCALNVLLNWLFIPQYSLYGAAWATVIAEIFNLILLQHFVDWDKDWKMLSRMFFVVIFLVAFMVLMKMLGLMNNIYVGSSLMVLTVLLFWGLGLLQKDDVGMFYLPFKNKFRSFFHNQDEV